MLRCTELGKFVCNDAKIAMAETHIKRRELYDQVWKTPMRLLGPKYGLSDVGLAKICKKHNIPLPGKGYWVQVKYGVAVGPALLPNPANNHEIVIIARQPPAGHVTGQAGFTNIFNRALCAEAGQPVIAVTENRELSRVAKQSLEALRQGAVDEWKRCIPEYETTFDLSVGEKSLLRAHRIMDTLLAELARRGCQATLVGERDGGTVVRFCGQPVGLRLIEMLKVEGFAFDRTTVRSRCYEDPPRPPWLAKQSVTQTQRLTLCLVPTGSLCVDGLRRLWRDTDHQRLEDCLNDVIVGIVRVATAQRASDLEWVKHDIKCQALEEEANIQAHRSAVAAARKAKLEAEVAGWTKAQSIRAFVQAAGTCLGTVSNEKRTAGEKWLKWALKRADKVDPLSSRNIGNLGMNVDEDTHEFYVRPAMKADYSEIRKLISRVSEHSSGTAKKEAKLVDDLVSCGACDPELSLVAIRNARMVGYVMFSNVGVRGRPGMCGVAMGPLCVDPRHQRQGIGTELVETGLSEAKDLGKSFVCVRGPLPAEFSRQFHFEPVKDHGIETSFPSDHELFLQIEGAMVVGRESHIDYPDPWYEYYGVPVPSHG